MPEIKVIKVQSREELDELLSSLREEIKRDKEKGEVSEVRYDKFIDCIVDLCLLIHEEGEFKRDANYFRENLHSAPEFVKRAFFKSFAIEAKEIVDDIMELCAELAWLRMFSKKTGSEAKATDKKVKDNAQTKKEKENSNLKKK